MASTFQVSAGDRTKRRIPASERIRAPVSHRAMNAIRSSPWKSQLRLYDIERAHSNAGHRRLSLWWTGATNTLSVTATAIERIVRAALAPSTPARRSARRSGSWRWRATSRVAE